MNPTFLDQLIAVVLVAFGGLRQCQVVVSFQIPSGIFCVSKMSTGDYFLLSVLFHDPMTFASARVFFFSSVLVNVFLVIVSFFLSSMNKYVLYTVPEITSSLSVLEGEAALPVLLALHSVKRSVNPLCSSVSYKAHFF